MKPDPAVRKLSRFIATILGRCPDEYGLVPDRRGFVKTKELLKAITEENGWRHIRQAHLNEALLSLRMAEFEIIDRHIRASDRSRLPGIVPATDLPKLLYTCVRRRAYPHVCRKGLSAAGESRILLTVEKPMAEKIGRRKDSQPVLLTVQVESSREQGVSFDRFGEQLFLSDFIPAGCFSGPPLPKEKAAADKQLPPRSVPTEAGTYRPDPARPAVAPAAAGKERKRAKRQPPEWKRARRRQRKQSPKW